MKIIQLQIYLFMCYQATESQTNIRVALGEDVTITCDLDIKEIYWFKQKSPDPPVFMLRTYEGAAYENSIYKLKYSVKTNSRLFISNISADESGVYYCVKTSEPLKFSNGTKIFITNSTSFIDCVHKNQSHGDSQQIPWRNLTFASASLNVFFAIAFIGLGNSYVHARGFKNSLEDNQTNTEEQNSINSQYAEVDFPSHSRRNRSCERQSIYSLLQPIRTV